MKWSVKWYIPGEPGPLRGGEEIVECDDEGDAYRQVNYLVRKRYGDVSVNCSQAKAVTHHESWKKDILP